MNETDLKNLVRQQIAADSLDTALQLLIDYTSDHEKLDGIIIHLARFNQIKKEEANGTIAHSEINNELNKLRSNLLAYIRTENLMVNPPLPSTQKSLEAYEECLALSFTRVKVAQVLMSNFQALQGLTITDIQKESTLISRKLIVDFINELNTQGLVEKIKEGGKTIWRINEKGDKTLKKKIKTE